jgi:hypothetical protein
VKFWTCGVWLWNWDGDFDDELSTRYLIKRQRKLGESLRPIDQLRAVVLGGALGDRLNKLSDRQIGQLFFDFCWPELYVDGPYLINAARSVTQVSLAAALESLTKPPLSRKRR